MNSLYISRFVTYLIFWFSEQIVFPDALPNKIVNQPVPSCKNSKYCLQVPDYPSDMEIENALKLSGFEPISEVLHIVLKICVEHLNHNI